jgi:hypothetical protein
MLAGIFLSIVVVFVFFSVRADYRATHAKCLCHHEKHQHVSWRDWDSDYGDPGHVGANYRIPGTCRACRCRAFIPDYRA